MAKKLGKLMIVAAALGAVAGGVYYYLKDRDTLVDDDFDDDDFDNFDEDPGEKETDRNYVDLDLGKKEEDAAGAAEEGQEGQKQEQEEQKEGFKEGIQTATAEAADKVVGSVKKVEEFFDDDDSDGSMDAM